MVKIAATKCVLISLLTTPYVLSAGDFKSFKLRSLGTVTKVKKQSSLRKEFILDQINEFIGDDIDINLFDKRRDGLSIYAKLSKVSKVGFRYRY